MCKLHENLCILSQNCIIFTKIYNLSDQYEFHLKALLVTLVTNMRFDEINKISHHRENLEIKSAATNRNGNSCVSLKKAKGRFICTHCVQRNVLCFVGLESEIDGIHKGDIHIQLLEYSIPPAPEPKIRELWC